MKRSTWIAVLMLPVAAWAADYAVTDMSSRTPTRQELIEALKPDAPLQGLRMRGIKLVEEHKPKAVNFSQIHFEFDSDRLTREAQSVLTEVGAALSSEELRPYAFEIQGHTDAKGSDYYNLQLSKRRADSVKRFLVRNFEITPARLKTVGKGEAELWDRDNPESGVNRRVQIVNLGG